MKIDDILKVIAGTTTIAQKTAHALADNCSHFIEEKIVKGHYVSREEFETMKQLVIKLQSEIQDLKSPSKE